MLILDYITVFVCVALALLMIGSSLSDVFFRKVSERKNTYNEEYAPVSVVIISDNNSRELEANLGSFLTQDYPAGYEVIVVVSKDEDGTHDVLQSFSKYSNLRTTFVPDSSRYISRGKLAITLGVKAVMNEWILLTDACCHPVSDKWISGMYSKCAHCTDMVLGYSNYSDEARPFMLFERLHREYAMIYEAGMKTAYATAGNNLMFRKSIFMKGDGFRNNLKYIGGEYEFLLNKYAGDCNVAVSVSPDSFIIEEKPSRKKWRNKRIFYIETRKHLQRSLSHRFIFNMDMLSLYLCMLVGVCSMVYAFLFSKWLILFFSFMALSCLFAVRIVNARRVMLLLGTNVALWKVIPFEFYMVWNNLRFIIKYKFSDKYEFISHKL